MRSIIFKIFRKISPFDGLVKHSEIVTAGVGKFKDAVEAYLSQDFDLFEKLSEEVINLENEADRIKSNTRYHLHKGIFMPVDRGDFLSCLKQQDSIIDACEDAVIWMQFRKSEMDEALKENIKSYLGRVIHIVQESENLVKDVHRLISSISLKERKEIKDKITSIHFEEEEIDNMQRDLIKTLFSSNKDMLYIYHIIHVVFLIGSIADYAENVGDRIRVMMAR
ncbi:MAG: TIGR00153 family protein [Elusimicrobia bacterium]|nr:TIGR00153 family protein [Elusimicrobiota bacterium]